MDYQGDQIGASPTFIKRLRHAWNAFNNKDPITDFPREVYSVVSTYRPDRNRTFFRGTDQTIAIAIYTRIATDCASAVVRHCRVDDVGGFIEEMDSGLNQCLTVSANIDQTGKAFIQDVVMSMLDEGTVAMVPIDTSINPMVSNSFDILTMRTGKILQWYPDHVLLDVYNDRKGIKEQIKMSKEKIAIIENPFYSIMNEPNSILKRLVSKMAMLDTVDEQVSSGKLDLLIQLPYSTKSDTRQQQAELRRRQLEEQLKDSKYGVAWIDASEHVTQLNRPVENNLLNQIQYLTSMLYGQLGMTEDILNGTASEEVMVNYYRRTVDVILTAIVDELSRKFLTKTARTQGQAIKYYRDPFSLTPTSAIADIADKFTRNEILTPNEVRGIVGFRPATDPQADELRNRNISQASSTVEGGGEEYFYPEDEVNYDEGENADEV